MTDIRLVAENEALPPEFSDDALALQFAARHEGDARFVPAWKRWLFWNGQRWEADDKLRAVNMTRLICRRAAKKFKGAERTASGIASNRTVNAVLTLARADERIVATIDRFDADPWVLNTPNGLIDLRTGDCHPNDPAAYCTKITAVGPRGDCPLWLAVIDRVTAGNRDLARFLQSMIGYCLTGLTREHALFFWYGTGANGKSVVGNTMIGILGDYARIAPIDMLMTKTGEAHPTELAMLHRARLVAATETEQGRRWDENRLKVLTGGDRITARRMRQDFWEFDPTHKLVICGNHKPGLRSVDEAIRRRMNLVPFIVTIPREERDDQLTDKLKDEWPGILSWAIRGAVRWTRNGLETPEIITKATEEYLSAEDAITQWLEDCCRINPNHFARIAELFNSWKVWAEAAGEYVGSKKRLAQELEDRGFHRHREGSTGNKGFRGVAVHV